MGLSGKKALMENTLPASTSEIQNMKEVASVLNHRYLLLQIQRLKMCFIIDYEFGTELEKLSVMSYV